MWLDYLKSHFLVWLLKVSHDNTKQYFLCQELPLKCLCSVCYCYTVTVTKIDLTFNSFQVTALMRPNTYKKWQFLSMNTQNQSGQYQTILSLSKMDC